VDERFENLTETQKRLLREVAHGRSSKAMSRDVGLEPGTIDVYLSQTLKILGFTDRRAAADAFAAYEAAILNRSKLRPEALVSSFDTPQSAWRRRASRVWRWVDLPPVGGRANRYGFLDRVIAAFKIAGLGFVVIICLMMAMISLFWVFGKL
jgi:DNA-binding CsgD family transcriptional regulator